MHKTISLVVLLAGGLALSGCSSSSSGQPSDTDGGHLGSGDAHGDAHESEVPGHPEHPEAGSTGEGGQEAGHPGDGGCEPESLVSGSVSPANVAPGGSYTVLCNYGSVSNAVDTNLETAGAWGQCTYVGFTGDAAKFTCTAGSAAGTYPATCILSDYSPSYFCARTDPAGSITVGAGSEGGTGDAGGGSGTCAPSAAGPGGAGAANVPGSQVPAFPKLSSPFTVTGLDASGNDDVGPVIQAALNAHGQVIIPGSGSFGSPSRYNVATQVNVPDGAIIECETGAEFLDATPCEGNMAGLFLWSGTASVQGAGMYGCMFRGTAANILVPTSYNHSFIRLNTASNYTIEGNYTTNSCGDADIRLDGPENSASNHGSTHNLIAFNDVENAENGIGVINAWNNTVMCNTAFNGGLVDEEPNQSYPQCGDNTYTKNYEEQTMSLSNYQMGTSIGGNGTSCPSGSGVCATDIVTDNVFNANGFSNMGVDCECNEAGDACDNSSFGGQWSGNILVGGTKCSCGSACGN